MEQEQFDGLYYEDSDEEFELDTFDIENIYEYVKMIQDNNPDLIACCMRGYEEGELEEEEFIALCEALSENTSLRKLDLGCHDLGNKEFCILLKSLTKNTTLNELRLQENGIVVEEGEEFLELIANNKDIRSLDLRGNFVKDVKAIFKLIKNSNLQSINLGSCFRSRGNVSEFLENLIENEASLQKSSLQHIGLDKNQIGLEESKLVANLILGAGLKKINLGYNNIGDDALIELAKALRDKKCFLEKLDLCYNQIGLNGARALLDHLTQNDDISLRTLSLNSNDLGCEGAVNALRLPKLIRLNLRQVMNDISVTSEFANALSSNNSLVTLNLSQNNITDDGVGYVTEGLLDNKTLKELIIYGNKIGDEGVGKIADMLNKNASLIHINLSFNKEIGNEGVKKLADALKDNTTLQKLNLNCINMEADAYKALAQALEANTTLTDLNLEDAKIREEDKIIIGASKKSIRISLVGNKIIQAINDLIYKDVYDIDDIDKKKIRGLVIEIAQGPDELKAIGSIYQLVNCSKEMQGVFTLGREDPTKKDSQNEFLSLPPEIKLQIMYNLLPKELQKKFSTDELTKGKKSQTQNDYKLKQLLYFLDKIFRNKAPSAKVKKPFNDKSMEGKKGGVGV